MLLHLTHPSQHLELLGLLLLWAAFLFGGLLFGKPDAGRTRRMPTWTRLASSGTLVLAAWSWYFFTQDTSLGTFSLLIAIGMTVGCLGDLLLASTAGFATGLALQDATFLPLALGAALFLARRPDPGSAALQPLAVPAHRRCHLVDVWSGADVDCLYIGEGLPAWVNLKV